MVLLVATIIITSSVYFVSIRTIERNIDSSNGALLNQMQETVDRLFRDVESLAQQIALNSNLGTILYSDTNSEQYLKYVNTKVITDLKSYHLTNRWVEDFYIYAANPKKVFTPNSVHDVDLFQRIMQYPQNMSMEEWTNLMETRHVRELVPVEEAGGAITYLQSIPVTGPHIGTIVILINMEYLHEVIKSIGWAQGSSVFMVDDMNRILASNHKINLPAQLSYEKHHKTTGFYKDTVEGEEVVISYRTSDFFPIKYISVIPVESYMGELISIKRLTFTIMLSCLIIGSIVAYFFSNRNYIHVNELVNLLKGSERNRLETDSSKNEFYYLKYAISKTIDEKKQISRKLEQQEGLLRSDFLSRLLKGKVSSNNPIEDALVFHDIRFVSEDFLILLFRIEDTSPFFRCTPGANYTDELLLACFIVRNVIEEMLERNYNSYMVEMDDFLGCLVNFKKNPDESELNQLLEAIIEARQFFVDKFSLNLTISMSNTHKTVVGIPEAYHEALEAMEYKIIYGRGGIIRFSEINHGSNSYYYPLEVERQLINQIKAGNLEEAEKIINDIFNRNFTGSNISIQTAKCLMFNLVSTMIKTSNEVNIEGGFIQDSDAVDTLLECQTIHEMKERMIIILSNFCKYAEDRKQSHNVKLLENIIKYIRDNYQDKNMSITSISAVFDMNPIYVSRFFKEQSGESILDTINRIRLKHAKKLLRESKKSVEDIAGLTGYSNVVTFIRVFKKYEGITPGRFREGTS